MVNAESPGDSAPTPPGQAESSLSNVPGQAGRASLADKALAGKWLSFAFFLIAGAVVAMGLGLTVHNRSTEDIVKTAPPRYRHLILFWINRGYFKHGGLWVRGDDNMHRYRPPPSELPVKWAYRTTPMGYLQLGHLLERIHYAFTGRYSPQLMAFHNQGLLWLSSALLGLLAMRMALRMEVPPFHAMLLGLACQIVHGTFPINLNYYWEVYYTTVTPIFMILLLLLSETALAGQETKTPRRLLIGRALCVFGLFYTDMPSAILFLLAYLLCCALLVRPALKGLHVVKTMLLPAAAAMLLFAGQLLWAKVQSPGLQFVGSSFMFRTGFDGSTAYYKDHFDLFFGRARSIWVLLNWRCLFLAGAVSVLVLVAMYHRIRQLRIPVFMVLAALGMYVPFAFLFGQGTAIHPYAYDSYLVIPLVLALFAVVPATIERLTRNTGIFVLLFFVAAFCYCMVQIRAYAMAYPLT